MAYHGNNTGEESWNSLGRLGRLEHLALQLHHIFHLVGSGGMLEALTTCTASPLRRRALHSLHLWVHQTWLAGKWTIFTDDVPIKTSIYKGNPLYNGGFNRKITKLNSLHFPAGHL